MSESCGFSQCSQDDLRPFIEAFCCSLCKGTFCIEHRNPERHQCSVLEDKERSRQAVNQTHEDIIAKLLSKTREAGGKETLRSIIMNNDNHQPTKSSTPSNSSFHSKGRATFERVKLRMQCVGDDTVPMYNRVHVRILLGPGVESQITVPAGKKILPSQRSAAVPHIGPDLYVWLDKTKSIGFHIDYLKQRFNISCTTDHVPGKLFLVEIHSDGKETILPYTANANSVSDGTLNLKLTTGLQLTDEY